MDGSLIKLCNQTSIVNRVFKTSSSFAAEAGKCIELKARVWQDDKGCFFLLLQER